MTAGPTPKTFTGTSALNLWDDIFARAKNYNLSDSAENLNDVFAFAKEDIPKTFQGTSGLNLWADLFARSKSYDLTGDTLDAWADVAALLQAHFPELSADDAANLADLIAAQYSQLPDLTDDALNLGDSLGVDLTEIGAAPSGTYWLGWRVE